MRSGINRIDCVNSVKQWLRFLASVKLDGVDSLSKRRFKKSMNAAEISVKELSKEEMQSMLAEHFEAAFGNRTNERVSYPVSDEAQEKIKQRNANNQNFELRLAMYAQERIVGWHYGYAIDGETYYMQNSAIMPEFRNQGMYTRLLEAVLTRLQAEGFQVVSSFHHPNNAAVLIPKLKKGFIISGSQFNERFRFLIEMKYFYNSERRKAFGKNLGLDI